MSDAVTIQWIVIIPLALAAVAGIITSIAGLVVAMKTRTEINGRLTQLLAAKEELLEVAKRAAYMDGRLGEKREHEGNDRLAVIREDVATGVVKQDAADARAVVREDAATARALIESDKVVAATLRGRRDDDKKLPKVSE